MATLKRWCGRKLPPPPTVPVPNYTFIQDIVSTAWYLDIVALCTKAHVTCSSGTEKKAFVETKIKAKFKKHNLLPPSDRDLNLAIELAIRGVSHG